MNHKILSKIQEYARQQLIQEYGYCGVAEGENMAMLNSGADGENLIIKIENKQD